MNYDKIGEFISEKRKEKNLTQLDLAKKIGVTDKAVSKWERGLGCPDISILEVLAKELDVSVLELLKGRKIENEVIKVTEADDYVKESFKVSKDITRNRFLNIISEVLFYLIVFISVFFIGLSVKNYLNLSKKEQVYLTDIKNDSFEKVLKDLKQNIEIIKTNRGILTLDEQQVLVRDLEKFVDYYENDYFVSKLSEGKYTINDILLLFLDDIYSTKYPVDLVSDIGSIYENHKLESGYFRHAIISTMVRRNIIEEELFNYYFEKLKYFEFRSSNSLEGYNYEEFSPEDLPLTNIILGFTSVNTYFIDTYNLLIKTIIEAGE